MKGTDERIETWCPRCREAVREEALQVCMICRRLFCHRCEVPGYGRLFCSKRCRDFFFYGELEEGEEES